MASSQQSTFLLSAADVSWGTRECFNFNVNDVAANLGDEYFVFEVPSADFSSTLVEYYLWFNLDAGGTDPAIAGKTGIEIALTTGEDEAAVALAIANGISSPALRVSLDSNVSPQTTVVIEAEFKGPIVTPVADVSTGFTFNRARIGLGGNLGRTSGGIEVTMETTSATILSDQSAQLILDEFYTGQSVEATMSFLEMTPANWRTIVGSVVGDVYTPPSGTELVGFGESRLYQSFFDLGGELVLHPSRFAASDRSYDITFWKSVPKPGSINFSGEEAQTMEVTFSALLDSGVQDRINLMAFGDSSQDVSA